MFLFFVSLWFLLNFIVLKCMKSVFVVVMKKFCLFIKCVLNISVLFVIYLDEVCNKIFCFYGELVVNVICSFIVDLFIFIEIGRVLEYNLVFLSFIKIGFICR